MVASKFLHHLALEQQLSCTSQLELSDAKSCGVKKCHRSAQKRIFFSIRNFSNNGIHPYTVWILKVQLKKCISVFRWPFSKSSTVCNFVIVVVSSMYRWSHCRISSLTWPIRSFIFISRFFMSIRRQYPYFRPLFSLLPTVFCPYLFL